MALSVDQIPTLAALYRSQDLSPAPQDALPDATPVYNDRICLFRGDITTLAVGAIVNAANKSLLGGGGVDGAIHRAAGRELLAECRTLNGCATGSSKITDGYNLPANKVIHTVGPVYSHTYPLRSETALRGCYESALKLAVQHELKSIAFSAISTGIYGYPSKDAAVVAIDTVKQFLVNEEGADTLDKIVFVTFEEKDDRVYRRLLPRTFPPADETPTD
ncbi:MACRO domain-containing protein [Astrocystis sublimbata]|nr:MACRO domain-containing protein [Astrocystis sublimbata]